MVRHTWMAMRNNERKIELYKHSNGTTNNGGGGDVVSHQLKGIKTSDVYNRSKSNKQPQQQPPAPSATLTPNTLSSFTNTTTTPTTNTTTDSLAAISEFLQHMTNGQHLDKIPQHGGCNGDLSQDQISFKMAESWPKAIFTCEKNSHPFVRREVLIKDVVKIGRAIVGSKLASDNCLFDCRVLSRNHAILAYRDRKFLLKDTKSSNGTFLNNVRLSNPSEESGEFEVFSGDLIKFGVDITEEGKSTNPTIYPSIIATVTLYHPDGKEAVKERVHQLNYDHASVNVSSQQLVELAHYVEMADFREIQLHMKLTYLEQQLAIAEQSIQESWQSMVKEDMLLSKIEALQNKLQTVLTSVQNNKPGKLDDKINSLRSELLNLHNAKEVYEKTAKETIKSLYEERLDYQNRIHTAEARCATAEVECRRLKSLVEELQKAIHDSNEKNCHQLQLLDESKQKHVEMNERLLQINVEKMTMQQQLVEHLAKENQLNEQLQELNIELEAKQLQLDSLHALQSERKQNEVSLNNHVQSPVDSLSGNQQVSVPVSLVTNKAADGQQPMINDQCDRHLEELQLLQNSIEEMRKERHESERRLNEMKEEKNLLEKNLQEIQDQHAEQSTRLAVVERELIDLNKSLFESQLQERVHLQQNKQLMETVEQLENSLHAQRIGWETERTDKQGLQSAVEALKRTMDGLEEKLSSHRAELEKKNRQLQEYEDKFESMNKEINEQRHRLNELEEHEDDLHAKMVVKDVIDSVIDKIENGSHVGEEKYMQEDVNPFFAQVNPIESERFEMIRRENENLKDELRGLRDEFQNLSYQNQVAHLFAVLPLCVLFASIIFAYMRIISIFTGTKDL